MPTEESIEVESNRTAERAGSRATELVVSGMTCGNCVRHVTEAIQRVAGVRSAQVRLEGHHASVRWAPGAAPNVDALLKAVQEEGFEAEVTVSGQAKEGADKLAGWGLNLLLGIPVTILLLLGEWILRLGGALWFQWVSFFLACMVQVVAGARFYRGAWSQLKVGSSNMDTLVVLGSTTAFGFSTWAFAAGYAGHLYFVEASAIITLISVGHWLESRVSARASSALQKLMTLAPALARRRNAQGNEIEVPAIDLLPGDVIALRPGDCVPTDGKIVEGHSILDESMLTGESLPVEKSAGDEVYAGTVNVNGRLVVSVTVVGEETALAHIIEAVQRAQNSRANIQRIGDRVSSVFVPIVVAIAVAAGLWWGLAPESANRAHNWLGQFVPLAHLPIMPPGVASGFIIAASVLIIACPCAMGLATPAAIMAGSNAAAKRGILIRDGVALEKAGQVTAVIFDKTGTLTVGRPVVVGHWEARRQHGEIGIVPALGLAYGLAKHSAHPLSHAVAKSASGAVPLSLSDWCEIHGKGVEARMGNSQVARLGSLRWLGEMGVDLQEGREFVAEWSAKGATIVAASVDQILAGLFAVKDDLKTGAHEVIERLCRQGLNCYLVTGDNLLTAKSIASQAGIASERVFAEVRPGQKAEFVRKLQAAGESVAFVGDGINDAPALEQADLGIAVSRASDIAREAADIILLKSEIEAVPESLELARATLRTIKQNLFWAFFYNAMGIPLAALGFLSPIFCAAAMALSDLVVIGNALRLKTNSKPDK